MTVRYAVVTRVSTSPMPRPHTWTSTDSQCPKRWHNCSFLVLKGSENAAVSFGGDDVSQGTVAMRPEEAKTRRKLREQG